MTQLLAFVDRAADAFTNFWGQVLFLLVTFIEVANDGVQEYAGDAAPVIVFVFSMVVTLLLVSVCVCVPLSRRKQD